MQQAPKEQVSSEQMVTSRFYPNTSGIFNNLHDSTKAFPQRPRSPNRNKPQPHYAKYIRSNTRFINEPFAYMEAEDTLPEQFHWMKHESPFLTQHIPAYSLESTQRHDYQKITSDSHAQTRHGCNPNKYPCSGIVPQVDPRELLTPPTNYREYISFIHQYDARKCPNEPIRGKRHGAFVCTQINSQSGKIAPRGEKAFLVTEGSHSLEQLKEEKGNMGEDILASPKPSSVNFQQMLCSGTCLSKPDPEEAAKAYPRIPNEGQNSLWSQTNEVHGGLSEQQQVALDLTSAIK
ncbi:uncharacterized protein C2orf73 [Rhincodon typus]|uniref:uncharacterized protein C2orf73 n=1 Tax=Rhincodon typus TaxID=259920 RepID=UPI0009A44C34|nr:uncharacterized protein C2orf73 [Rhincodon typus]